MDLRLVSDPLTVDQKLAVVSAADVVAQGSISQNLNDLEVLRLQDYICAAYDRLANPNGFLKGCCLLEEEWEVFVGSGEMGGRVELPLRPIKDADALVAFEWIQSDGSYLPITAAGYHFLPTLYPFGRIERAAARTWPYFGVTHPRAYRIQFKAGFGTSREDVPVVLRQAIAFLAESYWLGTDPAKVTIGLQKLCGAYMLHNDHS